MQDLEEQRAAFQQISDQLKRGGNPVEKARPTDDAITLLNLIAQRLELLELAGRPANGLWAMSGTTAGERGTYQALDEATGQVTTPDYYKLPFIAKSLTLVLPDAYGMHVKIANRERPMGQIDELHLQGPIAYTFPLLVEEIQLRALDDTAHQAGYTLIASEVPLPVGVAFGDVDTEEEEEVDTTLAEILAAIQAQNEENAALVLRLEQWRQDAETAAEVALHLLQSPFEVSINGKTFEYGPADVPGIGTGAAYASGDAFGIAFDIPLPKSGVLQSATFLDLDNEGINKELWIFPRGAMDGTLDNAAFAPLDLAVARGVKVVPFSGFYTAGGNQVCDMDGLGKAFTCPTGWARAQFVTRGADNIAAGSIPRFTLTVLAD